jgi:hypothetical protein
MTDQSIANLPSTLPAVMQTIQQCAANLAGTTPYYTVPSRQIPRRKNPEQRLSPEVCASGYYSSFVLLEAISVGVTVAISTKRDQIFASIIAKCAARTNMVHLKAFRGSAILAAPAIPLKDITAKLAVGIWVQTKPRFALSNRFHAVFSACRRNSTF